MAELKGSKTEQNLMKAFAGESQARNRYTYYAGVANKEGYRQIEGIFIETAEQEREHAKVFFKHLVEGLGANTPEMVEFTAGYPVALGNTAENLRSAAAGEREEWSDLYKNFGQAAAEEGFDKVAESFKHIAEVEKYHEERYNYFAELVETGSVFKRDEVVVWKCRNCGYLAEGQEAPRVCPACKHGQAHFEQYVALK
ncbi:MAG TPA: rubrerythrin family protein [Clostridiaceae bacterium]|jgi:rubrerythrin|nr:rubrerythrin family protein [Clostridiaceae bacterium]